MGRVQNKKVGRECGGEYTLKNFIAALKAKSQVRSSTPPPPPTAPKVVRRRTRQ